MGGWFWESVSLSHLHLKIAFCFVFMVKDMNFLLPVPASCCYDFSVIMNSPSGTVILLIKLIK